MAVTSHVIAAGPGWWVNDTICTSGPDDPRYEEQHAAMSMAAVTRGSFQYRGRHGAALLVPGALLLGNAGACFECGHEHGQGDRCLAFHFSPDFIERHVSAAIAAGPTTFAVASLPPLPHLARILADAEIARDERDHGALEELALQLAGTVYSVLADAGPAPRRTSARDERRITAAVRRIEAQTDEALPLGALARDAAMSRYHFLRTFRHVVGVTPHQYILRTRLHRAALRLRRTDETVSAIAYDAGFSDLSTFNRRFRRVMGVNPGTYRARRR